MFVPTSANAWIVVNDQYKRVAQDICDALYPMVPEHGSFQQAMFLRKVDDAVMVAGYSKGDWRKCREQLAEILEPLEDNDLREQLFDVADKLRQIQNELLTSRDDAKI